jgi:hypothetical protein
LNQSADLAKSARADVISLFDNSAKKANIGIAQALDFYKQNAAKRMQPFMQANQSAQNVIGLGARQANNAILGLPVDMSFTNQPQVQADYGGIMGAALPQQGTSFADQEAARIAAEQPAIDAANAEKAKQLEQEAGAKKRSLYDGSTGGLTMSAFDRDRLDIDNVIGNPLGISGKKFDKVNPAKLLRKLF